MRVRGIELAVRETGEGRPFVWGHGLLGCMAQEDDAALLRWSELAPGHRLVRYDTRGHGRSEATLDPADYRWPELARDMLSLVDSLGAEPAEPVVLGGVSMGCATSLHAALAAPERVAALVLMAPPTAWQTRPRQARMYRFLAGLIGRLGLSPFRFVSALAGLAASALAPSNPALASMQRTVMDHLRRADRRAVVAALRGAAESDLPDPDALRALDVPALILAWSGDPTHPVSTAERLAELLPAAELHVAGSASEMAAWSGQVARFLGDSLSPAPAPSSPPA